MIARFRRLRWLATLLIAVSPALGGQLLPLLHPCPVDAPWLAAKHAAQMIMAPGSGAHQMPAHHEAHQHACSCVGACNTPAIASVPQIDVTVVAVAVEPRQAAWPLIEARDHSVPIIEFLPLSTAPPST